MMQIPRGVFFVPSYIRTIGPSAAKPRTVGAALRNFRELKPDVVVLDLPMPDISGIRAAKWMSESDPTVPLILFTIMDLKGSKVLPEEPVFVQSFPRRRLGSF
jgi:DNA-binding response OmpR family regulator